MPVPPLGASLQCLLRLGSVVVRRRDWRSAPQDIPTHGRGRARAHRPRVTPWTYAYPVSPVPPEALLEFVLSQCFLTPLSTLEDRCRHNRPSDRLILQGLVVNAVGSNRGLFLGNVDSVQANDSCLEASPRGRRVAGASPPMICTCHGQGKGALFSAAIVGSFWVMLALFRRIVCVLRLHRADGV